MKYEYTTGPTERFLCEESGDYLIQRSRVAIMKKGESIFALGVIEVQIDSEAGEEYVAVRQLSDDEDGAIRIYRDEWPVLRQVLDAMVARCRVERK